MSLCVCVCLFGNSNAESVEREEPTGPDLCSARSSGAGGVSSLPLHFPLFGWIHMTGVDIQVQFVTYICFVLGLFLFCLFRLSAYMFFL